MAAVYNFGTKNRQAIVSQPTTSQVSSGCTAPALARNTLSSAKVSNWKTYSDTAYKIDFTYPENWSPPVVTPTKGDLLSGDYENIVFNATNGNPALVCVGITSYESISAPKGKASLSGAEYVKRLKFAYAQAGSANQSPFLNFNNHLFTPIHSADYGNSVSQYIQSADRNFKGYYFYSQPVSVNEIANQYNQFSSSKVLKMDSVLAVLTDGQDKVIQIVAFNKNNSNSDTYQHIKECNTTQVTGASCQVSSGIISEFNNVYKQLISSIKAN